MFKSSSLIRVLYSAIFILVGMTNMSASKTTWIGALPGGDWSIAANWDNGVPTQSDSAIIVGGNDIIKMNVLISSNAVAAHITIDDFCILSISPLTLLNVVEKPTLFAPQLSGIRLEEEGSLLNFGSLNVSNFDNSILVLGNFENHGSCTLDGARLNGLLIAESDNIFLTQGSGTVQNKEDIIISNTGVALFIAGNSQFTNDNLLKIQDCNYGISNYKSAIIHNNSRIDIINIQGIGITNSASFTNNSILLLKNTGISDSTAAIVNIVIAGNVLGGDQTGYFENNSNIVISDINGSAIRNGSNFLNKGIIRAEDVFQSGVIGTTGSTFTITDGAFLILISIPENPLDIHQEADFDIADGGSATIRN